MGKRSAVVACAMLGLSTAQAAAPDLLRNRSFVVSWTESRTQREAGQTAFRDIAVGMQMTVYVSSAGRPFSRLVASARGGSVSHGSVGTDGTSLGAGHRKVSLSGSRIVITSNFGGAARQIVVDASEPGCSARVSVAKLQGTTAVAFSRTDGRSFEVRALSAGAASCAAQNGNAFGR